MAEFDAVMKSPRMGAVWLVVVPGVIAVSVPRFGMVHCDGPCTFTVANALFSQGVGRMRFPLFGIVRHQLQQAKSLGPFVSGALPGTGLLRVKISQVAGCGLQQFLCSRSCFPDGSILGLQVGGAGAV